MRKRTAIRAITFLSAAAIVAGVSAWTSMKKADALELYARANTQHAFDELVTSVSELSTALEKSVYITDPALESALCTQMFGRAVTAQMALGVLPYSSQQLEQTASFVSKVGDYAGVLARTVGENGGYSDEELENLKSLSETAGIMAMNLKDMQTNIQSGALTLEEIYRAVDDAEPAADAVPLAGTVFESMEAEFPELPTLIYDGPFSESMVNPRPLYLEGRDMITEDEACRTAADFLRVNEDDVSCSGDCAGNIPCWSCVAYLSGGEYTVHVTKRGGEIISVLCSRTVGQTKYSVDSALAIAENFLASRDMEGMAESYHMVQNGVLVVNYEYEQDGVICYPDLIKVGIALDNGSLMSYDARGYISAHRERDIPEVLVSREEAEAGISGDLEVESRGLAIIPSEGGEERLCHEFVCTTDNDQRYILYVNAVTGDEEKILILLEDEAGTLTI